MMTASPASEIEFEIHHSASRVPDAERARLLESPGFGQVFTDHMITLRWTAERGWHDGKLEPYGPFSLDPATAVFHYAQEFFEGLKAYKHDGGAAVMFRPQANAARFNTGARRMAMPELPEAAFIRALELLVSADRDWIPAGEGNSLYLRPFMIATQRGLGVNHPSSEYLFCVIASPAASYFGPGKTVRVWLSQDYTRAAPGGTGDVKCGGNYAAAFLAQQQAVDKGCDQVVWLDAAEHKYVEEMGGMNLYFVYGSGADARLVTPQLTGSLLPGITRDSLLKVAPTLGIPAVEGRLAVEDWRAACQSGELTEVFACGTAAVITPVGSVDGPAGGWTIGTGNPGPVTMRLRDELVGIQYGHKPDPFNWVHKVA
ncbi:MAG TPA: branched-chain amino acid aminotransferase [Trebonia sp.]|jgi:branched-chain amino acid aminotransferase|nr:branched-chain amino acid aminotransferase [Trebonia sp.]